MVVEIIAVINQAFMNLFVMLTQPLMNFFVTEILLLVSVEKYRNGFKFRFSSVKGYPGLKPFASTLTVVIFAFIIYFILSPLILEFILGATIESWLNSLGLLKILPLFVSLSLSDFILLYNFIFGKKMDKTTVILGAVAIIFFILFLAV